MRLVRWMLLCIVLSGASFAEGCAGGGTSHAGPDAEAMDPMPTIPAVVSDGAVSTVDSGQVGDSNAPGRDAGNVDDPERPTGEHDWSLTPGGGAGWAVGVDDRGRVAVTGRFVGTVDFGGGERTSTGDGFDGFVAQYAADGSYRWDRTIPARNVESAALAVGPEGEIVAGGSFRGGADFGGGSRASGSGFGAFVVKFDADGTYAWDRVVPSSAQHIVRGIAIDSSSQVVIGGSFTGSADFGGGSHSSADGGVDAFIAKYSAVGDFVWERVFGAGLGFASSGDDIVYDVDVDSSGNVFAVGEFMGTTADFGGGPRSAVGNRDAFVMKANPDGAYLWDRTAGGAFKDRARGVTVDRDSGVLVVGDFRRIADFGAGERDGGAWDNGFLWALDSDGTYRWDRILANPGSEDQLDVRTVATAPDGAFVVGGGFAGTIDFGSGVGWSRLPLVNSPFVASYDHEGNGLWAQTFSGQVSGLAYGVAIGQESDVFAVGTFSDVADFGGGVRTGTAILGDLFFVHLR